MPPGQLGSGVFFYATKDIFSVLWYNEYYKLYNGNRKKVVQKLCEIFGLKYSEGDM